MRIEINPRSLKNLNNICEVLYKLHPSVLDDLVEMERSLGDVLGFIDLNNLSLKERDFLSNIDRKIDYSKEPEKPELPETKVEFYKILESNGVKVTQVNFDNKNDVINFLERFNETNEKSKLLKKIEELEKDKNSKDFHDLKKYIKLDTDEYIPMKIYIEVEDPVIGRKLKELVKALEKTRAPEQFYFHKREVDEDAYFAEGYGLTMNEEQEKQLRDFLDEEDVEGLRKLLIKEKLIF